MDTQPCPRPRSSRSGGLRHRGAALLAGFFLLLPFTRATQTAIANGDTRTLDLIHTHTHESLHITYKRDGQFDTAALEKLNWFLRDWRIDEPTSMAPGLFDVVWAVYQEVGAGEPIRIVSAYRSPGTNAMLRRRSRAVAKESQHIRGNAMDVHIPGVSMAKAREIGMRLQRGGVGYYPTAGTPFVHLDVGTVRSWPRMPRDQLERLFPDGKTVHLPSDGIPLAQYQAALAEIEARGGAAPDYSTLTALTASPGRSLWALLFGGSDEEEDSAQQTSSRPRGNGRIQDFAAAPPGSASADSVMLARVVPQPAAPPEPAARAFMAEPVQLAGEKPDPAFEIAAVPVPPIRPQGLDFRLPALAGEPLPPIRPKEDMPAPVALAAAVLPALPMLAETAPRRIAGLPLPPPRPMQGGAQAARENPPARPVFDPLTRPAGRMLVAGVPLTLLRPASIPTVAEPEVAAARGGSILAMRFTQGQPQNPSPVFEGRFIRPLAARFIRQGG